MKRPAAASLKKDSVKKGSLKKDNPKNQLNSTNLKKLGEVSLKEKIAAASEENSDEEQAAIVLHSSMTGVEKSNAWNQHQNHLKNPGKRVLEKGIWQPWQEGKGFGHFSLPFEKNKAVFGNVSRTLSKEDRLKKREK